MQTGKVILIVFILVAFVVVMNYVSKESSPKLYTVNNLPDGTMAVTTPPFGIFIRPEARHNKEVLEHEQCHWNQYRRMGLIDFWKTYLADSKKYPYHEIPMEKECFDQTQMQ